LYTLRIRERSDGLVRELVLDDPAPFVPLPTNKQGDRHDAKTVMLAGRRYIICRERQLAKGDNALIGNTGFRSHLKTISDEHFAIDPDKIEEEKKLDGSFVLRTNTDLNPPEAMLWYKTALDGGADLPNSKASALHRSIFHKLDETIRGHVFCSFLVLVRRRWGIELQRLVAPARPGGRSSPIWIR
jgi:hypothetical protein